MTTTPWAARVFVVEDEAPLALELGDLLRELGYDVCGHAARGEDALAEVPRARPDVVLMDVGLAGALSGVEVAEKLRGGCDAEIIFLTAHRNADVAKRAARSGSIAYLLKPVDRGLLHAHIEIALDRRAKDRELRESEARFRVWFEQAAVGVAELDGHRWRFLRVNRKCCEILGFTPEEMLTLDATRLLHPEDRPRQLAMMSRLEAGEVRELSAEARVVRKDGVVAWVSLSISPIQPAHDAPPRHIAIVQDVTARRSAELDRRQSEARFEDLFDSSPDAILMVDAEGFIVLANRRAELLFGYSVSELVGMPVELLMPESGRRHHVDLRRKFLSSAMPRLMGSTHPKLSARRKDGTVFPVDIGLSRMRTEGGGLVIAAVRDMTERAKANEDRSRLAARLRESQKMEAIGTLAAGIAHDFNNILAAIVANVFLAKEDAQVSGATRSSLDEIELAAARATDLVRQILAFGRKQPLKREAVAVPQLVEEAVKLVRVTMPQTISVHVEIGDEVPPVWADATQLHQVVVNLCTNAWHAIRPHHGTVTVAVRSVTERDPTAESPPRRVVCLSVSDDGVGIDPTALDRIFEPFFTTKEAGQGTGLGLAVVHGIVADHEGTITVESTPGRGTTFRVLIPAAAVEAPEGRVPTTRPVPRAASGQHVLLVDDDEALLRSTAQVLGRLGYRTTSCTRASEALDAVRADPTRFDVVMTDQNMPEMNGSELRRALREICAALPVLIVSGIPSEREDDAHALAKPYTASELTAQLVALTRERGVSSPE